VSARHAALNAAPEGAEAWRLAAGKPTQADHLDTLIAVAMRARRSADGDLFGTTDGLALVNAMHALTECDALYEFANDIAAPMGLTASGERVLPLGERL
jgi:hypothetical protein